MQGSEMHFPVLQGCILRIPPAGEAMLLADGILYSRALNQWPLELPVDS